MNKNGGIQLPRDDKGEINVKELIDLGKKEQIDDKSTLMTAEEQAMYLINTVKCRLAPSQIHGVGVIAIRDIKKGDKLFCVLTTKPNFFTISYNNLKKHLKDTFPEILQLILDRWPNVVNGQPFLSPNYDARLISFMNHSDTPNYDPHTDTALQDIKAGDEVFENYRTMPNYEKAYPWLPVIE